MSMFADAVPVGKLDSPISVSVDAREFQDNLLSALDGSNDVQVRDYQMLLLHKALKENVRVRLSR